MTATRRRRQAAPREAKAGPQPQEEFYARTAPQPMAGHTGGVVMLVDDRGVAQVRWATEADAAEFPKDVRQAALDQLYADRKARFELARRPGVAIPLPDDFLCSEDPKE